MSDWTGTIDWTYAEERPALSKGGRMVVSYADDRPDETFVIDDVRTNDDGSQSLDVHRDGADVTNSFLWYPARDEPAAHLSDTERAGGAG